MLQITQKQALQKSSISSGHYITTDISCLSPISLESQFHHYTDKRYTLLSFLWKAYISVQNTLHKSESTVSWILTC